MSIMIGDLLRQCLLQRGSKKGCTSNNTKAHYGMHLFANWRRQNVKKVFEQILEKEGK